MSLRYKHTVVAERVCFFATFGGQNISPQHFLTARLGGFMHRVLHFMRTSNFASELYGTWVCARVS